jgi:single-stranded DNA-binding protein
MRNAGNSTMVEFSIAVGHYVGTGKGYNGGAYETEWVRGVIWAKDGSEAAKIAEPLRKGAEITACGEWNMEIWKDKEGATQTGYKLKLSRGGYEVQRPGSGDSEPRPQAQRNNAPVRGTQAPRATEPVPAFDDGGIPF